MSEDSLLDVMQEWETARAVLERLVAACQAGDLEEARARLADDRAAGSSPTSWVLDATRAAANGGHVHILQWLAMEFPEYREAHVAYYFLSASVIAAVAAASAGRIPVLKWLRDAGFTLFDPCGPPSFALEDVMSAACRGGQVATMQWLCDAVPALTRYTASLTMSLGLEGTGVHRFFKNALESPTLDAPNWLMEHCTSCLLEDRFHKTSHDTLVDFVANLLIAACGTDMTRVAWVLTSWPCAMDVAREKSVKGRLLAAALEHGQLEVVRWVCEVVSCTYDEMERDDHEDLCDSGWRAVSDDIVKYLLTVVWKDTFTSPATLTNAMDLVGGLVASDRAVLLQWVHQWVCDNVPGVNLFLDVPPKPPTEDDSGSEDEDGAYAMPRLAEYLRQGVQFASRDTVQWLLDTFPAQAAALPGGLKLGFFQAYCDEDKGLRYMRWVLERFPDTVDKAAWAAALKEGLCQNKLATVEWAMAAGGLGLEDILACPVSTMQHQLTSLKWAFANVGPAYEAKLTAPVAQELLINVASMNHDAAGVRVLWSAFHRRGLLEDVSNHWRLVGYGKDMCMEWLKARAAAVYGAAAA